MAVQFAEGEPIHIFSPLISALFRVIVLFRGVARLRSTIVLSVPRSSEIIPTPPIVNRQ